MLNTSCEGKEKSLNFGTFGGVFTPSVLTIFGVIMFMRANYIVGAGGIANATLILALCMLIAVCTTLSIGAISSNMTVKGGGAYFIVSRVLGAEFGGAIGLLLFLAQVVSISFYLLGFVEAVTLVFPLTQAYFMYIGMAAALLLFSVSMIGADWALKTQYFIMAVLFSSIFVYLAGASQNFSGERFYENLYFADSLSGKVDFWALFAIYFPGVTGFIAGIDMSGDLKNPSESLTKGTLYALLVAGSVYFLQILFYGAGFPREMLMNKPFQVMVDNAFMGASFMVVAGVAAATLSSALGRFVGTPRVLQAVAKDDILPFLKPFSRGYGPSNEPRPAIVLCLMITLGMFWLGGDGSGGSFLNSVAAVMGMFFLYTFGLLNLSSFIESYTANPSFRPRFKFFHWSAALVGMLGSFGSAILIDFSAAMVAMVILCLLILYLRNRDMKMSFGDARRGFLFARIKDNLLRLNGFQDDIRNWRPSILTLSGNPSSRETLVTYSVWLNAGRGLVILANILIGKLADLSKQRLLACEQLNSFLDEKSIQAFSQVVVADDVPAGVRIILQGSAYGPLRPNLFICGWMGDSRDPVKYVSYLREATFLNVSQILVYDRGLPDPVKAKRIDIWWRGHKNGPLMILMAHLLSHNWEWSNSRIVLKRVIQNEEGLAESKKALQELVEFARVAAEVEVVVGSGNFADTLHKNSKEADCVFIGFELPDSEREEEWFDNYEKLLQGLPTTLMVHSTDARDYLSHD